VTNGCRFARIGFALLFALMVPAPGCAVRQPTEPRPPLTPVQSAAPAPASVMAPSGRFTVVRDPGATALAAAVVAPGSAWELPGTQGLTILVATTLLEQMRPALDRLGAWARVRCSPAAFTFTLVAPEEVGDSALAVFLNGLFRPTPADASLTRARDRLEASLILDEANPGWQVRAALRSALYDDSLSSGWLDPPCGVPETLGRYDLQDLEVGTRRFAPHLAYVAVVTPGAPAPIVDLLHRRLPEEPGPPMPAPRAIPAGELRVERSTVTSWVALAFPFGPEADIEAVGLLGAVLADAIAPAVDRPESFSAHHELQRHGAGGALVITAVTEPAAAEPYMLRVAERLATIALAGVPEPLYRRVSLRNRGLRLLERATPEARAEAMALDLALGRPPAPWPDTGVAPDRVRDAARALEPPARALVGPRSDGGI
jgi:hypothetical protein